MPKRLRLAIVFRLPPHRRLWLVRRLIRLPRRGSESAEGTWRRVRDQYGGRLRAHVVGDASPVAAQLANLRLVTDALEAAAIPYFCVRPYDNLRTCVAIPADRKTEAIQVLRRAAKRQRAKTRVINTRGRRIPARRANAIMQVFRPLTSPSGTYVLGGAFACEVEFWRSRPADVDGQAPVLAAPRPNCIAEVVPEQATSITAPAWLFSHFTPYMSKTPQFRTLSDFVFISPDHVRFPIDAVYTWVDGDDPQWRQRKEEAFAAVSAESLNAVAANDSRYISRDELRYSLRSLFYFAPWIRHIYIVSDDQVPAWLDLEHPDITVVPHRMIFGDTGVLPTFNSHAIESRLHRIPGLSEHFIYLNDDVFLGRPLLPSMFFYSNGIARYYPSTAQIELGARSVTDAPVNAAGKNNRSHLEARFGRTITQKMRHVPHALRRSVFEEIEQSLPKEVFATATHQFRDPDDLSIPSSLHHYWSLMTSRSVPAVMRYSYADLAHPSTPVKLRRFFAGRDYDVFCLNDTDSSEVSLAEQHEMLSEFLSAYFPFRSPYELPDDVVAQRSRFTSTELGRRAFDGPVPRQTFDGGWQAFPDVVSPAPAGSDQTSRRLVP